MGRNNSLDGFKFVLFLGVFFFHAGLFPLGWGGVEFYLFITAFLLTIKLLKVKEKEEVQVGKMIIKRWKRLSPLFYLVVCLLTIYFCFQEHNFSIPDDFWSFIPFGQNFFWLIKPETTKVPACFHFWYLTLDFYLFIGWAILFRLVDRSRMKKTLICLLLFSIIYRSVCPLISDNVTLSYTMPWGMFDTFALGSLAAFTFTEDKTVFRNKAMLSFIAGGVLFLLCVAFMIKIHSVGAIRGVLMFSSAEYYGHHPITIQIILVMTLFAYTAVWFCMSERKHFGVLSNAKVAKLGTMSYELYVLHFPALFFTRQYVTNNKIAVAVIAIIATILLSFLWDNRKKLSLNNRRI